MLETGAGSGWVAGQFQFQIQIHEDPDGVGGSTGSVQFQFQTQTQLDGCSGVSVGPAGAGSGTAPPASATSVVAGWGTASTAGVAVWSVPAPAAGSSGGAAAELALELVSGTDSAAGAVFGSSVLGAAAGVGATSTASGAPAAMLSATSASTAATVASTASRGSGIPSARDVTGAARNPPRTSTVSELVRTLLPRPTVAIPSLAASHRGNTHRLEQPTIFVRLLLHEGIEIGYIVHGDQGENAVAAFLVEEHVWHAAAPTARAELIRAHLPLVASIARGFAHRGEELDDLVQVGTVGLIAAADRFDAARGVPFAGYAAPTIAGEIRRHLRDRAAAVRLPRRLHELRPRLAAAERDLGAALGRTPTASEVAGALDVSVDDVERLRAEGAPPGDGDEPAAADVYDWAEDRLVVLDALRALDERRRAIVHLRFFGGLSQSEIGARLGLSQIHVSRLLRSALDELRAHLNAGAST